MWKVTAIGLGIGLVLMVAAWYLFVLGWRPGGQASKVGGYTIVKSALEKGNTQYYVALQHTTNEDVVRDMVDEITNADKAGHPVVIKFYDSPGLGSDHLSAESTGPDHLVVYNRAVVRE